MEACFVKVCDLAVEVFKFDCSSSSDASTETFANDGSILLVEDILKLAALLLDLVARMVLNGEYKVSEDPNFFGAWNPSIFMSYMTMIVRGVGGFPEFVFGLESFYFF